MGAKIEYEAFIGELDKRIDSYFEYFGDKICCHKGCSSCCEKGDYPMSDIELNYLMKGYLLLDTEQKLIVQNNVKNMVKGGSCPFLINSLCSVYKHRPVICRVHGLAYICKDNVVKLPYCANNGKNFSEQLDNSEFVGTPIKENLDSEILLKEFSKEDLVFKNLYDWIKDVI